MRCIILITIFAAFTFSGCGGGSTVKHSDPEAKTLYYVIFKGNPKIDDGKKIMRGDAELGRVISVTIPNPKVVVVQIGINAGNEIWLRDNVAFYLKNNQLHYAELTAKGQMLEADAKILGFSGRAQLYWFKAKAPVNEVVKMAQIKAEELYRMATL